MKKNYQIPTIDIAEIRFCAALLDGSFHETSQPSADGGGGPTTSPDRVAPRRKVF